ncbi:MAG: C25 family cysteine peptidase [Thermoplasmatota archaeon]
MRQSFLHQVFAVIFCCMILYTAVGVSANDIQRSNVISSVATTKCTLTFSSPIISEHQEGTSLSFDDSFSWLLIPGNPKMPMMAKVFTFPLGTNIIDVSCQPTATSKMIVKYPVRSVPAFQSINGDMTLGRTTKNSVIYNSMDMYPSTWFDVSIGGGLGQGNIHETILTLRLYPLRYIPLENTVVLASSFDISVTYELPEVQMVTENAIDEYDLVIITPDQFVSTLTVLKDHKERYDMKTLIKTTNEIYSEFSGWDNPERIKYFIKYAIETYHTNYVLLIGDIKQLPIRSANSYPWDGYHGNGLLSDLYYADIYDASGAFCSWDANNNRIYGEVTTDEFPPLTDDNIDKVDLYADVHVGRIPCTTNDELIIMINKIITYEQVTYDQTWFQKIILIGGDTFPLTKGSPLNVFEGEITNIKVAQQLPGFEKVFLWSSERNLNAHKFNQAISEGSGFVSYAGHGFEHGWGTYRPNAIIDSNLIIYYSPFIKGIQNEHRLPVVFFDACLTAKFDFNISDLIGYYGLKAQLVNVLLGRYTADDFFSPFAWSFIKHEGGGGIAAVGATRPAYTYVDKDGVYAGAGYLDVHFFKAYEEGVTAGQMMTQAQNDYLNNVGLDVFTIEEFELLGDPSLRVGGYPQHNEND